LDWRLLMSALPLDVPRDNDNAWQAQSQLSRIFGGTTGAKA
jgi:hypothetical protein